DGPINVTALAVLRYSHANPRADSKSISVHAHKIKLDPVIPMTRILEQYGPKPVGSKSATDHFQNVLVTVVINVAKRHSVTLLQMTKSARSRYVIEVLSLMAAEHPVGNGIGQRRRPCTEIEIQPAVVIQVTEICAHR